MFEFILTNPIKAVALLIGGIAALSALGSLLGWLFGGRTITAPVPTVTAKPEADPPTTDPAKQLADDVNGAFADLNSVRAVLIRRGVSKADINKYIEPIAQLLIHEVVPPLVLLVAMLVAATSFAAEPNWQVLKPIRALKINNQLDDLESQLPAGHPYRFNNRITWAHEASHGVAGRIGIVIDQRHPLYCLHGRYVVLQEPATTMTRVRNAVPLSLRGDGFKTYLVDYDKGWERSPLYVLDEWIAYTNQIEVGNELDANQELHEDPFAGFSLSRQFVVYSTVMLATINGPVDPDLVVFVKWNAERLNRLFSESRHVKHRLTTGDYWETFQTSDDAYGLRQFARRTYGDRWCLDVFGF